MEDQTSERPNHGPVDANILQVGTQKQLEAAGNFNAVPPGDRTAYEADEFTFEATQEHPDRRFQCSHGGRCELRVFSQPRTRTADKRSKAPAQLGTGVLGVLAKLALGV